MRTINFDNDVLIDRIKRTTDGHIKYKLGAKCDVLAKPEEIKAVDCSGYVRWLIYQISGLDIGDGSWNQRAKLEIMIFKHTAYDNCQLIDGHLRIAFINPEDGKAGHVWLIKNGQTIESYGGRGPGRRPWNNRTLKRNVDYCFVLA